MCCFCTACRYSITAKRSNRFFWRWPPAGPFFSTPFFLAAQRRVVSSRQEEVAGDSCTAVQLNKRAAALLKSWEFSTICAEKIREYLRLRRHSLSVLSLRPILFCLQRPSCRAANFRSLAVTRHFCSAKVLVRGLRWEVEGYGQNASLLFVKNEACSVWNEDKWCLKPLLIGNLQHDGVVVFDLEYQRIGFVFAGDKAILDRILACD